ncbi:MAG: hypothetical protein AB7U29_10130 [Desulfobulbus sp.]
MFRITTLNEPCSQMSADKLSVRMSPLLSEGIDLLCCQSIAHASTPKNTNQDNETDLLADQLRLTCSCFAADRQQKNESTTNNKPLRGQAIFTGPGVWMLNSGSFAIGEDDCEEVVLFALVRKNGSSVLVFNFHLADSPKQQALQLTDLFQHSLLQTVYGAVAICTDRESLLSPKKWHNLSATSCYTPFQFESTSNGLLTLLNAKNGSITNYSMQLEQEKKTLPGLSLSVDIKRTQKNKRSRPSFPLSFREQWLGYRDNRAFA